MGLQESLTLIGALVFLGILLDALRRKKAAARKAAEQDEYQDPEEAERQAQLARELPGLDPLFDEIEDVFDDDPIPVLRNKQEVSVAEQQTTVADESLPRPSAEEQAWEAMRRKFSLDPAFAKASQLAIDEQQRELQEIKAVKVKAGVVIENRVLKPEELDDLVDIELRLQEEPQAELEPDFEAAETEQEEDDEIKLRRDLLTSLEQGAWGKAKEFLTININAPESQPFNSVHLRQVMDRIGMQLSASGFYHFLEEKSGKHYLGYSLINMFAPGSFDAEQDFTTKGVVLVMSLPNCPRPMPVFERMLATAKAIEKFWGAELQDEQRSDLTQQTIEHYRQKIKDFEYQTKVDAIKAQRKSG